MQLTIIETGAPAPDLLSQFGTYGSMIERWLRPMLPEAQFRPVALLDGEPLPAPQSGEGFIITGSRHGVYDDLPWMRDLIGHIQMARQVEAPVAGICFGHQIMAAAYGGRVEKSEGGWSVGRRLYRVDPALTGGPDSIPVLSFHQDQVVELPPEARLAGGSDRCRYGVLTYPFAALSVQFHPEFSPDYVAALLARHGGIRVPADVAREAEDSLAEGHDPATVAALFATFFRRYLQMPQSVRVGAAN